MQTVFIEENIHHQQIINICNLIKSSRCKSLEFRRCTIATSDFDELMNSLSYHSESILSLIFNIKMINERTRFNKFIQMLSHCVNLINLRIHGNDIDDDMFSQLCSVLHDNCPMLLSLDIGDNQISNKSITPLCSLIIPDDKRAGLEELVLSANRSITNVGWSELLYAISFSSRIRRLLLDYNILDNTIATMLSMIIASSRTLLYLDLECCNLTEFAAQLFLTLLTKYPVSLEEINLEKNLSILESTRILINECLNLRSRRNSISSEQQFSHRLPIDDDATNIHSKEVAKVPPLKLKTRTRKKKTTFNESSGVLLKEETKRFNVDLMRKPEKPVVIGKQIQNDEDEIEELQPIDIEPYGTIGRPLYWRRI